MKFPGEKSKIFYIHSNDDMGFYLSSILMIDDDDDHDHYHFFCCGFLKNTNWMIMIVVDQLLLMLIAFSTLMTIDDCTYCVGHCSNDNDQN